MSGHKWFVIARNEYRISTSKMRAIRPYFPCLALGLSAVYVGFIAPMVVGVFMDDFLALIISAAAIPMVQIVLFTFFFFFLLSPIGDALRDARTERLEALLAAPIMPSDVLLGEFLGKMPFYAIAMTAIAGSFVALLNPLGLDIIQNAIIIVTFIITFLSAIWIGTVIASILRTRLAKAAHGRDVGRALSVVIVLPGIAMIYAIIGGNLLDALVDPATSGTVRAVLDLLPSSWGAEIFSAFAHNPGNMGVVGFETLTRLGGLLAFFLTALWLGTKAVNRAYSLEPTTFTAPKADPDGPFYKAVRYLGGGGSSGILLASTFKDYGRRLENLSWLVYTVAIVAFMGLFNIGGEGGTSDWPGAPLKALSLLAIPMLSGFVVGTVSRGKEIVLLYRKSPSGMNKFIITRLTQSCLVAVPLAALVMASSTLYVPQFTTAQLILNTVWASLRTMAIVAFVLGLATLIPTFSYESRTRATGIMINLQIVMFATIGLEVGLSELGLRSTKIFPHVDRFTGLLCDYMLVTAIWLLLGAILLSLGRKKLDRIE